MATNCCWYWVLESYSRGLGGLPQPFPWGSNEKLLKQRGRPWLRAYLIFVHFGTPPHYLGSQKIHQKCVNLRQNSQNRPKLCVFYARKYTRSKKVHHRRLCGCDKYELWLATAASLRTSWTNSFSRWTPVEGNSLNCFWVKSKQSSWNFGQPDGDLLKTSRLLVFLLPKLTKCCFWQNIKVKGQNHPKSQIFAQHILPQLILTMNLNMNHCR